ncbi:MAG: hypothetical protein LQ340_003501 [Diploschistes diacapsis]|nr:MAG: hypothetical protein LQ340_003501 [Diploschistes diacapsis]
MARISRVIQVLGALFILAAAVCLVVGSITTPIIASLPLLRLDLLNNGSSINFGTFGYCVLDTKQGGDYCTSRSIGYPAATEVLDVGFKGISDAAVDSTNGLTNAFILHPIACAVAFIACLVSLDAGTVGSIGGPLVGCVAWILTIAVMAIDLVAFDTIIRALSLDPISNRAYYGPGLLVVIAAATCTSLGMFNIFFACWYARYQKKKQRNAEVEASSSKNMGLGERPQTGGVVNEGIVEGIGGGD